MKATSFIIILLVVLLGWSPWITEDYARDRVISLEEFRKVHQEGIPDEDQVGVAWLSFGKWVATYEKGWFVTFLGFIF